MKYEPKTLPVSEFKKILYEIQSHFNSFRPLRLGFNNYKKTSSQRKIILLRDLSKTYQNQKILETHFAIEKEWQNLLYKKNVIIIEETNLSVSEFIKVSHKFGTPWTHEIHKLHRERISDDGIDYWDDQSGLYKMPLCWHKDNPWHPKWRCPIRFLLSKNIPDSDSGILHYLDLRYVFNHILSKEEQNWLNEHKILIQDFRNKERKFFYPLIEKNPVTNEKSLFITAMDIDYNFLGLKKHHSYKKGHTSMLKVIHSSGKELPLTYFVEYIKKNNAT